MGPKDNDFLGWVGEELFIKVQLGSLYGKLQNKTPEKIVELFESYGAAPRGKPKERDIEEKWWFEKRVLFLAQQGLLTEGRDRNKDKEIVKMRRAYFQQMMSR